MDSKNKAMKAVPYTYATKYGEKTVEAATMFDINKTIMRCLVKNLAMFGLGLYIYAGEDLPQGEEEPKAVPESGEQGRAVAEAKARAKVYGYVTRNKMSKEDIDKICKHYKCKSIPEMSLEACNDYIRQINKMGGSVNE